MHIVNSLRNYLSPLPSEDDRNSNKSERNTALKVEIYKDTLVIGEQPTLEELNLIKKQISLQCKKRKYIPPEMELDKFINELVCLHRSQSKADPKRDAIIGTNVGYMEFKVLDNCSNSNKTIYQLHCLIINRQ